MVGEYITIQCLELTQPIGTFYVGVIRSQDLVRIAHSDIRRLDHDLDDYLGIERQISPKRVEELQRYVNSIDATFPTAVVVAISSEDATYDSNSRTMQIRAGAEVAKIIDGQHRIKGLMGYRGDSFEVNLTIFIDMDLEDQAMVFATINLAQTKVSKSLVYDLYEYTRARSPQKTAHNIARLLNARRESPFYQRIKILGTAEHELGRPQTITQATFVEAVITLISGNSKQASEDRDQLKRESRLRTLPGAEREGIVFRELFRQKKDAEMASIIWNYFDAVRLRWPEAWNRVERAGNVLPRTNGFRALMRFFPAAYSAVSDPGAVASAEQFLNLMRLIPLADGDFTTERYKPGSSGERTLLDDFSQALNPRLL